jgi:small-conductance mechanosensitive channel/CRP-like cAMP-binding protein
MTLLIFLISIVLLVLRILAPDVAMANLPEAYGPLAVQTIGLLLAVALAFAVDRVIRKLYWRGYFRAKRGHEAPALMEDLVTALLLTVALSIWLYFELSIPLSGVLAASGVTALIVGFALQTMILDLFSGVSINLDGSYRIGDWLTLNAADFPEPIYGKVEGLTWRSTILRLENGNSLIVPNRFSTLNPVTNHSRPRSEKRLSVDIIIDLITPADRAMRLLLGEAYKAVQIDGLAKSPPPTVILNKLHESSAHFQIRFYAFPDKIGPNEARSAMLNALHNAIRQQEIQTPVHQLEMLQPPPPPVQARQTAVIDAISRVELFAETLNAQQMADLAGSCAPVDFDAGVEIIRQGDEGGGPMFIILEGAARISIIGQESRRQELGVLASGDIFGEMSVMTGSPRIATVTTLTALHALKIDKANIEDLLASSAELLQKFGRVLAERQAHVNALNNRAQPLATVERDLIQRMRSFFSRTFHATD